MKPLAALVLASCAGRGGPPPPSPSPDPPRAAPSPADLIYFVLVDRFANGQPANDDEIDLSDPHAFHGGDLAGVKARLDHLEELGVRTVWLSPIFEMRTRPVGEWGAFHGYWVRDLQRIEPRFGDEQTLRELAADLHQRDMRLVLDMVYNHTDYDAPLRHDHPDWYHDNGDITDWQDPVQLVTHDVHGLPDLAQENPEVSAYLEQVSTHWIDRVGVDGYRIDAVRHLPLSFSRQINARLDAHRPGFWTLGEDFHGDPGQLAHTLSAGGFDAIFDFPLRYAMIEVFCQRAAPGQLAAVLSQDRGYSDPHRLVTFLDNHDLPRLYTECQGDPSRAEQALAFMYASRGTPCLSYGTEALLPGAGEPENRADMPWDAPLPALDFLEERAALRNAHPVLVQGETQILAAAPQALAIARQGAGEVALLLLTGDTPAHSWTLPPGLHGARVLHAEVLGSSTPGEPASARLEPSLGTTVTALPEALTLHGAHTLAVVILGSPRSATLPWRALEPPHEPRRLRLVVTGPTPPPAGQLVAVGSGPELGSWDPHKALVLQPSAQDTWQAELEVPGGIVLAWKLALISKDAVEWQEGPNNYTFIAPDQALTQASSHWAP